MVLSGITSKRKTLLLVAIILLATAALAAVGGSIQSVLAAPPIARLADLMLNAVFAESRSTKSLVSISFGSFLATHKDSTPLPL
jgi:xanthine/uracil/vitamin C permease (AzgA family)